MWCCLEIPREVDIQDAELKWEQIEAGIHAAVLTTASSQ
jgi:hypothetical protein